MLTIPPLRRAAAAAAVPGLALAALAASPPAGTGHRSPRPAAADTVADSVVTDTVAPGVVHRRVVRAAGPWVLNVLEVAVGRPELTLEGVHPFGRLAGRQRPTALARALDARWCREGREPLAVVNGDLFELANGENEGQQVIAGEVVKAGRTTDSPWDTFDNAHTAFAVDSAGHPFLARLAFDGALVRQGATAAVALDGVNDRRGGGTVLYTPMVGARTPDDSARRPVREAPFTVVGRRGDTLLLRRAGPARPGGRTAIPAGGVVLSARRGAPGAALVADAAVRELAAVLRFTPDRGPLHTLVGGWGRVVANGVAVGGTTGTVEGTITSFAQRRHPRTAVGLSRDSATVYLVVVDGRSKASVGMSLAELGTAMRDLGAWDALNFDGGGSSAMVVGGRLVSVPSDSAGERTVGNALVVARRAARSACPAAPADSARR